MLLVVLGLFKAFFIVVNGYLVTICNSKMKHLVRRPGRAPVLQLPLEALLLRGGAGVGVPGVSFAACRLRVPRYACNDIHPHAPGDSCDRMRVVARVWVARAAPEMGVPFQSARLLSQMVTR